MEQGPHDFVEICARPRPVAIDLRRTALVVIDMQNDFLHPDGWFGSSGVDPSPLLSIVPVIADLADVSRAAGARVLWLGWGVSPGASELPARLKAKASQGGRWPTYGEPHPTGRGHVLEEGGWGAQIIDALTPRDGDLFVTKRRLSGFHDDALDSVLRTHDIDTLLFTGVNIDRCVYATLSDAAARGYECLLVEDACATSSPPPVRDAIPFLVQLLHGACTTAPEVRQALVSSTDPRN